MSVKRQLPPVPKTGDQQTKSWMSAVTEILRDLQNQSTLQAQTITKQATTTVDVTGLGISKKSIGLGNVDNTSDKDKPISDQTAQALGVKLDKLEFERFKSEQYDVGEWEVSTDSDEDIGAAPGQVFKITEAGTYAGKDLFVGDYVQFYEDDAGDLDVIIFVDPDRKADKTTDMIAGDGLTGGGTLASNRTFNLGTPDTITSTSSNAVTADSHTHALDDTSVVPGTYGTASKVFSGVVDSKGRLIYAVEIDISIPYSSVTGRPAILTGIGALSATAGQVLYATGNDVFSTFATSINARALMGTSDLYGLGTTTGAIATDLDLLTGKGQWFRWGVSTTHAPTGVGLGTSGVGIHLPRASTGSNDVQLAFDTNGRPAVRVCTSGTWSAWFVMYASNNPIPYNTTTASSPNAVITSTGEILRSTSSEEFKDPIEVIDLAYSMALLDIDGIWYRSTLPADDPNWSYYGFTAQEVGEVDPRLASWCTTEEYEENEVVEVGVDEEGQPITEAVKVKKFRPCTPYPNGVNYERFVPHHHMLIKKLFQEIEALKTQIL